jgi:hypothetical protein
VRQALFQNACQHAVAAAVHRLAEFSEESRDQPRFLECFIVVHEAVRAIVHSLWRLCDHDCGVARGPFVCF